MKQGKTALVLGATGGIGGETAAALLLHGWKLVAMARDPERAAAASGERLRGVAWTQGDAMVAADVRRAAHGVDVIVHAVNPPAYRGWGELVLPMIDNTIAAAEATGARIVLPGTVYNYGPTCRPMCLRTRRSAPQPQRAGFVSSWSSASPAPSIVEAGCSSSASAISLDRMPATTGSARGW